jgi:hypothetical protein
MNGDERKLFERVLNETENFALRSWWEGFDRALNPIESYRARRAHVWHLCAC